ncbi:DUF3419 family protein [Bdellovibrio sp. KM01]|uniref:DUF3419 family protein n=1 Tax=Bdellovibrio sp. KM01 TaxID=2748865 RepID=UPI00210399CD|nr:DUF3419 family protein [Bdellovibrio sp. KM01]
MKLPEIYLFRNEDMMASEYFSDLNYTLSNEDTRIEFDLLPENTDRVFSIAGSGARCMPLIAKNPAVLDVIDMSVSQNYLCELRFQSMKALTYEEYLFFMGYRGALQSGNDTGDDRVTMFNKLKLSEAAKKYWEERKSGWAPHGFILLGRWESHFQKLGYLFREVLKCDFSKVFEAQSLTEQIDLYEKHWPKIRWNTFIKVAASEFVFNKYLYKGHFSGSDGHKTESRPPSQFIVEEFDRIFRTQLVRKNYFMQILFLGSIRHEEGLPLEAHHHIFEAVKKSNTKVNYLLGNLLEYLPKEKYSFISLSDTISYLSDQDANQVLQKLNKENSSGTCMVIRSFMRAAKEMDLTGWQELKDKNAWAAKTDGTGVYQFHIYKKS